MLGYAFLLALRGVGAPMSGLEPFGGTEENQYTAEILRRHPAKITGESGLTIWRCDKKLW